jgi:hypothetical protein
VNSRPLTLMLNVLSISDKLRKAQSCQEDKEKMSNCY